MSDKKLEILNLLEIEDLTGDVQILAELTDLETVKKILLKCDGLSFNIQRVRNIEPVLLRYLSINYPARFYSKKEIISISKEIDRPYRETSRLLKKSRFQLREKNKERRANPLFENEEEEEI